MAFKRVLYSKNATTSKNQRDGLVKTYIQNLFLIPNIQVEASVHRTFLTLILFLSK